MNQCILIVQTMIQMFLHVKKIIVLLLKVNLKREKNWLEMGKKRYVNLTFVENFFSNKEDIIEDLSNIEDDELSDQEISFNTLENNREGTEQPKQSFGSIDMLKDFV